MISGLMSISKKGEDYGARQGYRADTSDALVLVKDALIRAAMPDSLKIGDPIKPDESRLQNRWAGILSAEHIPLSAPVTGEAYGAIA